MEWAQTYADALTEAAGRPVALTEAELAAVLDLARLVAHGTERRNAPLAAFLAGKFVAAGAGLEQATAVAHRLLPPGTG